VVGVADDVAAHGPAHVADADEADFHCCFPLVSSLLGSMQASKEERKEGSTPSSPRKAPRATEKKKIALRAKHVPGPAAGRTPTPIHTFARRRTQFPLRPRGRRGVGVRIAAAAAAEKKKKRSGRRRRRRRRGRRRRKEEEEEKNFSPSPCGRGLGGGVQAARNHRLQCRGAPSPRPPPGVRSTGLTRLHGEGLNSLSAPRGGERD